jgi:hypothetical protein
MSHPRTVAACMTQKIKDFEMKTSFSIALFVLALISCSSNEQVISEPEKIADTFFDTYKKTGPNEALTRLLASNKYITTKDVNEVSKQLEEQVSEMGDLQGIEKLKEVSYGDGIVRLAYLVKYSQQPVRFNFTFYQPGNGWRIQNFSYETDFIDELDGLVKPTDLNRN